MRRQRVITRGVSWTAFGLVASKGITVLSKVVLAALLVPEHFGMVAMVLVFMHLVNKASDLGLPHALVQRRRDGSSRLLYDSAFWCLLVVGSALVAAMWLLGVPFLVWFYDAPELSGIATLMSLGILLHNITVVPEAILTRLGNFKAIILSEFAGALVGASAAIALAYFGAGPWSMVAQVLIATACTAAGLLLATRWLPRLRFAASPLVEVKRYSSYILGSRALVYMQQNLDYLLLGKIMGAYSLGIYSLAFLLTETLRAHIQQIVSRVVFPVIARMHHEAQDVGGIYCGTIRYMTLIMFPMAMLMALYADEIIPLLFKDEWLPSVGPIRILALASMVVASAGTAGEVLKAIGKPNLDFSINLKVTVLVTFPALWLGIVMLGVEGAAWAIVLSCSVARIMFHLALRREIQVRLLDILGACGPALAGCLLMLLCGIILEPVHWTIAAAASLMAYLIPAIPVVYEYVSRRPAPEIQGPNGDYRVVDSPEERWRPSFIRSRAARMALRRWLAPWRAGLRILHLTKQNRNRRYLPPNVTVQDFFRRLDERSIEYVVIRWFEELPKLDRDHDLDLLVADHCVEALLAELSPWPIGHPVDIYSETGVGGTGYPLKDAASGRAVEIPVFPPDLAHGILQRRSRYADLCYVPAPQDHFCSLAYHAVYLKVARPGAHGDALFDDDAEAGTHGYTEALRALGARIGIDLSGKVTRARIANILAERGWRPTQPA
jgi:O-antigen/teichoic acid export membrane protein